MTKSIDVEKGRNWTMLTISVSNGIEAAEKKLYSKGRFASIEKIEKAQNLLDCQLTASEIIMRDPETDLTKKREITELNLYLLEQAASLAILRHGKVMGDRGSGIPSIRHMDNFLSELDRLDREGSAPILMRTISLTSKVGADYGEIARGTSTLYSALLVFRGGNQTDMHHPDGDSLTLLAF